MTQQSDDEGVVAPDAPGSSPVVPSQAYGDVLSVSQEATPPEYLTRGQSAAGYPVTGYQQPAYQQPVYNQPAYQQPAYQQPAYSQQPVYQQPGYQPPYSQPGYYQPGYPAPMGYPQQVGYVKPYTGTSSWALGFLIFIPIPYLSALIASLSMLGTLGRARRAGGVAAQNGVAAANWALTALCAGVVLIAFIIATGVAGVSDDWMMTVFGLAVFALMITHTVLVIIGTTRASKGRVFRVPFVIRFFRA